MKLTFSKIREAIIYITPNFPDSETIRYKVKFTNVILIVFLYSIVIAFITALILGLTPLKNLVYHFESEELKVQAEKTIELERKIHFLTKELEEISSVNKKLEYAFILATSDSLDTNSVPYDSLKYEPNENLPYGGNIFYIFSRITGLFFQENKGFSDYFIRPSSGLIINDFSPSEGHFGIDFAVQTGTSIYAAQGGLVTFSDFTIDDGYKIMIQHSNNYITVYKHCKSLLKRERDIVTQGELIALSGNTGKNTTGPHLHFEIWKDGKPQNPKEFFIK
jgi:murein DD-endopeptidase MepM/ murein hydrolase activator NlpD